MEEYIVAMEIRMERLFHVQADTPEQAVVIVEQGRTKQIAECEADEPRYEAFLLADFINERGSDPVAEAGASAAT